MNTRKLIAIWFLAMASTASWSARAETIFIICTGNYDDHFTVDLANGTVDNKPARINETAIDWEVQLRAADDGTSGVSHNHIDRTAGTYTYSVTYNIRGRGNFKTSDPQTKPCTVGSSPTTKF